MIHPGNEDPDKTYFIIRPGGVKEGLLSIWFGVLRKITWAFEKGYIPYVDFSEEYRTYCQYYVDRDIEGSHNAWEYYFNQPCSISKEEILRKKNVLLSGWSFGKSRVLPNHFDTDFYKSFIKEKPYIRRIVNQQAVDLFSNNRVLGVFIRGTDYVSLKPKNHPIQPTLDEMIEKVKEVEEQFSIDKIFLVTEDKTYNDCFYRIFGNKVVTVYNTVIDYKSGESIQEAFNDDPYERGLKYLVRVLLLDRCKYLVSSIASGSLFAKAMREEEPEYEYWFNLGYY